MFWGAQILRDILTQVQVNSVLVQLKTFIHNDGVDTYNIQRLGEMLLFGLK